MKKILLTLSLFTVSPAFAQADLNTTVRSDQASYQLLEMGSGALGVLNFPEPVTTVTTTRAGIIESQVDGSHVIIAGLSNYGETPMMVKTESGQVYTWRVTLNRNQAGRILNVTVQPAPVLPTPALAGTAAPAQTQPAAQDATQPADPQDATFTVQRVGPPENTSLLFQIRAGDQTVKINELALMASAAGKQIRLEAGPVPMHQIEASQTGYGVITTRQGQGPITLSWPYQEGTQNKIFEAVIP
ncbi:hypothetical protein Deipr_2447 (plasmid) [Deinococcus proteolyticus MRP]|uniref:Pilus formation protein N-terminal domain-containing protein n=1 Tax=Deinococcus proteolyticus (strain ATCC 35074 / DSM 20540 / JCM 6276 / NBRC 101906 / NCIMB 13154 / VKM Ac-1939 / CCM 2703 / MRP) TaxID=693977 RepID=F0RQK5_DEIPM|nr:hypothetical protein [Deinococcus proteolyticus]ADY27564.1 hypothetical protein Deipr_2447 [Deinococcus proteolyticus MRP]